MSRHVIYTNASRTELLQAFDHADDEGPRWKLERASRQTPDHLWGPPSYSTLYGTLDRLDRHAEVIGLTVRELHGFSEGTDGSAPARATASQAHDDAASAATGRVGRGGSLGESGTAVVADGRPAPFLGGGER